MLDVGSGMIRSRKEDGRKDFGPICMGEPSKQKRRICREPA